MDNDPDHPTREKAGAKSVRQSAVPINAASLCSARRYKVRLHLPSSSSARRAASASSPARSLKGHPSQVFDQRRAPLLASEGGFEAPHEVVESATLTASLTPPRAGRRRRRSYASVRACAAPTPPLEPSRKPSP